MNKNELANKIRRIDGLTNDEKSALIELLRKQKKYGLVWEDKPEDVEERLREELPVLIEDTGKAIISEDADAPRHILIEGDNLEALTALAYTHEGKIDVIYIDPPYNTGNKDFVYNDQFVDKEDSYRHSKWLSFMSRRLRIAKRLLSDKGVIFISIDDNEQAQLKLLCDEVFRTANFLGQIILKTATDNNPSQINTEHEYMLSYCANKESQGNWKRQSQGAKLILHQYKALKCNGLSIENIQANSNSWGNYIESVGDAKKDSGSKQETGTSEYWKANNIYDLAGNIWEWTQEKYSTETYRAFRGGTCSNKTDIYPVAYHAAYDENYTYSDVRISC